LRFVKIILAIFIVITISLSSIFFNRSLVVTSLVNSYFAQYHSVLTCLDFSFDANDDLMISRLCIDSPNANIELTDILIKWYFKPNFLTTDKIADAISAIHISSANIRAKGNFQLPESAETTQLTLTSLPRLIRQQLHNITLLSAPVDINVQSFVYQPFSDNTDNENQFYLGKFSATEQQLLLSLSEPEEGEVLLLEVTKKEQGFNAKLSAELARLRTFLRNHQTVLPSDFAMLLTDPILESWFVSGHIESQINWHEQSLQMSNQLTDFYFQAEQVIAQEGAINLTASLAWQASLVAEVMEIDFTQGNDMHLAFDQPAVVKLLTEKAVAPQLTQFLTDNAMDNFALEPLDSITVDFAMQTIHSDGVVLSSNNLNEPVKFSLNNIALNYHDKSAISADLQAAEFSFAGPIKLAQLNPFTQQPIIINVVGDIEQQHDFWQIEFAPSSVVELSQLALPADITKDNPQVTSKKSQPSFKKLFSHWQGNVAIPKINTQSQSPDIADMNFDLQIDNQIKQLNLPQILQLKTLELNTEFSGSFADIAIKAKVIADKLPIASAKISGDILQPNIDVFAKDILITDLLALQLKLPIELKLIDGMLTYQLSGKINNTDNLMANPMTLALTVKDVIGDVDGTWLQELNWQQKFILQNGQVKSLVDDSNSENNLAIAKIDTATPIINLSTKTVIDFENNEVKVKVNNASGKLLGGRFELEQAQWPFSQGSVVNVKLTKIDLEKLLELDQKQGIVVTGFVSGILPISYDGEYFLIKEGSLHNVGEGLIQVYNNPAVEELKASSTELKLAFNALENLHYHHLSSDVSMADDGYMLLITTIKGRNPDLDNEVNLNLNLSYDLLGLLESLNITEHFESKVIKGLQKKN
jgi:hypothetical protein